MKSEQKFKDISQAKQIISIVCDVFGIDSHQLIPLNRDTEISSARHIARYFICMHCKSLTLAEIATLFGRKDHSTIISSRDNCLGICQTDKNFKARFQAVENSIKGLYKMPADVLYQIVNKVTGTDRIKWVIDVVPVDVWYAKLIYIMMLNEEGYNVEEIATEVYLTATGVSNSLKAADALLQTDRDFKALYIACETERVEMEEGKEQQCA